jgi:hypothetical protein
MEESGIKQGDPVKPSNGFPCRLLHEIEGYSWESIRIEKFLSALAIKGKALGIFTIPNNEIVLIIIKAWAIHIPFFVGFSYSFEHSRER